MTTRRSRSGGYTFIEMMIAMAISVIVGMGVYGIFAYQRRAADSQRIVNDLQTGSRFAMDQIKRELTLAGYRAQDTVKPVKVADPHQIVFEYWDERATFDEPFPLVYAPPSTPGYTRHTLVSFRLEGQNLVRTVRRWFQGTSAATSYYMPGTSSLTEADARADFAAITSPVYRQTLATNVEGFALQYFKQNNEPWNRDPDGDTTTPPPFDEIRSVIVSLQARAAEPNPIFRNTDLGAATAERFPVIRLQSEVRLRNVDIAANPRDTTPPKMPENLRVWDPGICGQLELAWDANRESDLAGYTVFYGLATGSYTNRVRLVRSPGGSGDRERHTLTGLQATTTDCVTGTVTPVTYFIRVEAFDKSANPSARTAEVFGSPNPSVSAESTVGNDTTINPAVTPAPAGFVVSTPTTPADDQLELSWLKSPVVGLVGYRLYRGADAAFTPGGRRVGDPGSNIVADETTLTAGVLTYIDTGLKGCVPVHYKLAAIACDACLPVGSRVFATVSGLPTDSTKPSAPKLVARAGFQRVILSIENPVLADVPDFKETRVYFNAGSGACTFPIIAADGTVSNGRLIPDSGGVFTGEGTLASVNFDDENLETPVGGKPNLTVDSSYCILAVAYDQCGNHSDVTDDATDVGQQCGDCLSTEPCYGAPAPPLPTSITTTGCYGSLELTWPHLDPSGTAVRDFTGYRVYRCENAGASPCSTSSELWSDPQWTLLTGPDPVWFSNFVDSPDKGLQEGHRYSYRILATDCYWEQHHDQSWPDPGNNPNDNAADSPLPEELAVGRVFFDPSLPVLSGMMPDTAWTQYAISPAFRHNTVLFRLKNAADTTLGLKQATIAWEEDPGKSPAFLQRLAFGDGSTTPVTTDAWIDLALPLTRSSGSPVSFNAGAEFLPLDDAIPVHLTFKRADGVVDDTVNLRENQMQVGISYRNDSTGDETCSMLEKVYVPLGPFVFGTTQNLPHEGTVAASVAGENDPAMNSTLVPGNEWVDVYTNVSDSDLAGIRGVRLHYYVDAAKALGSAPPLAVGANPAVGSLPPYVTIEMVPVAGTQWRTPTGDHGGIPASNDANVWYFIVAEDKNGNFDREPEPDRGAFQYYQQPFDVCENVPAAPVLSWSTSGGSVSLNWTAPLLNTDGTSCTDLGGYAVYRVAAAGGPVKLADLGVGTLTWTDAPPAMSTETYTYYVTARDTCEQPGPNEGPASNWFTECEGATGCTVRMATTQKEATFFQAGDSFSVELFACEKVDGQAGESIFVQVCSGADASVISLVENVDTGTFRLGAGQFTTWLSKPAGAGSLDLGVSADDTIAVHAWSQTAPTGGCGSLTECSASLRVQTDPCQGIATPAPPTLTVRVSGSCKKSDSQINLSWAGADPDALLFYRVYRCGNANGTPDCRPLLDGSQIHPVGAEPDLAQTTMTLGNTAGKRPDEHRIWYQVEAVRHNGCSDRSLWQTAISPAVVDDCP